MATAPQSPWMTPGYFDAQGINRQREMAKILQQQGMQQPTGQMVGNRYVAPSFAQYLAPALAGWAGQYKQEKADTAEKELAARLQKQSADQWNQFTTMMSGDQGVAPVQGPTQSGANLSDTVQARAPVAPDKAGAINFALASNNPELRAIALEKIKGQKLGEGEVYQEFDFGTGKFETTAKGGQKYRAPIQVDAGSHYELRDPMNTNIVLSRIPKGVDPAKAAELADKGIAIPGGGGNYGQVSAQGTAPSSPGAPGVPAQAGGAPGAPAQAGGAAAPRQPGQPNDFTPKTLPTYQNDPSLSPQQNREARAKFNESINQNKKNAEESYGAIKQGIAILNSKDVSSGRASNVLTGTGEFFGYGGKKSQNDAKLKIIGGELTSKVPRMEGPQSDADRLSYEARAGQVGNPNLPIATRLAALEVLIDLNEKYYPGADWNSMRQQLRQGLGGAPAQAPGTKPGSGTGAPPLAPITAPGSFEQQRKNAPSGGLSPQTRQKYGL